MTEQTQKKGMSKGCLVGLIVAGVLVILVAILFVTCYIYKDDLVRMGAVAVVGEVQTKMTETPPEGVDLDRVNLVADEFIVKLNADTAIDLEALSYFVQSVQPLGQDGIVDADEADQFLNAMFGVYPNLADLLLPPEPVDDTTEVMEEEPAIEE